MRTSFYIKTILLLTLYNYTFVYGQLNDTSQIPKLLILAAELYKTNPDSALQLYGFCESSALSSKNNNILVKVYFDKAVSLLEFGENELAFQSFNKSLKLATQIKDEYYINASKKHIANLYLFFSNYKMALEYCLDALQYFEGQKNYEQLSGIYLLLTFLKYEQKDYEKAKEYIDLSLKYSELSGNDLNLCKSLLNLSQYFVLQKKYEKTLQILRRTLTIAKKIDSKNFIPLIYLDFAESFVQINLFDSTKIYLKKVNSNNAIPFYISRAYITYVRMYIKENKLDTALIFAKEAEGFSKEHNFEQDLATVYELTTEIYTIKNIYSKAYEYKCLVSEIKDSIFSKESIYYQKQLEAIYESHKKQDEIEQLSKEKKIKELENKRFKIFSYLLFIILSGLVLISFLISKQIKLKAKHAEIELEQKLLRTQMNPHFIFNSISAIQNFILEKKPLEASAYLSDFAKLMRTVLNSSSHNLIFLNEDIEFATHYLKLQQLRMPDKFDYQIHIDDNIDTEEFSVPPMLTQPFIENAIIHGIKPKTNGKGLITISYKQSNNYLTVEVQDNGIGRKRSAELNETVHVSKAEDITKQRIKLLAQKHKQKISFEIIDLYNENDKAKGTLVRFVLPFI